MTDTRSRDDRHRTLAGCRSKAKEDLARKFPEEFRKLYDARVKEAGIIRQFTMVRNP
jgi:hypothetical protein